MAIQALYTAATGMEAMQFRLDNVANNLANVSTTAFKRNRANFEDAFYAVLRMPGAPDQLLGTPTPVGIEIGLGTHLSSTQIDFSQGTFQQTGAPLDIAIEGPGFFQVQDGTRVLYTRAGNFTLNANGDLVMASADRGRPLEPAISFPPDVERVVIGPDGVVAVQQAGSTALSELGQIQLAQFINPQGLLAIGENLYMETDASGTALIDTPGTNGMGILRQGFLEQSNVEPVRELVELINTQRAFEMNTQVVQAADQSLQVIANLRRF